MLITSFGGIGLGLVWGWLSGKFDNQVDRPYTVWLSLLIATVLLSAEVYWLAGTRGAICFLFATLASCFVHTQWRKELRARQVQT